ncbi:hypothetical protein Tco_0441276 [Tanacetum coccineum]
MSEVAGRPRGAARGVRKKRGERRFGGGRGEVKRLVKGWQFRREVKKGVGKRWVEGFQNTGSDTTCRSQLNRSLISLLKL